MRLMQCHLSCQMVYPGRADSLPQGTNDTHLYNSVHLLSFNPEKDSVCVSVCFCINPVISLSAADLPLVANLTPGLQDI